MPRSEKILKIVLVVLIGLFCFSLFKNIQYPLLWQDEADTAMFGERILKFWYPKAHDRKNYINSFNVTNSSTAINQKYDAFIYPGWIPFYFTAPWVLLAQSFSDFYQKTVILRIPFALVGLLSLIILSYAVLPTFGKNKNKKLLFLILFAFFELFSVSTILHMREVRYYSLAMLITYLIFYIHFRYSIFKNLNYKIYFYSATILLVILFNIYYPLYFILLATLLFFGIIEIAGKLIQKKLYSSVFLPVIMPLTSLILVIPFIKFFEIFKLTGEYAKIFHSSLNTYFINLQQILNYFQKFEFSLTVLFTLVVIIVLSIKRIYRTKIFHNQKFYIVLFLSVFFIIHIIFISSSPLMFTRYFIDLLPILSIIIILNFFMVLETIKSKNLFLIAMATIFVIDCVNKIDPIRDHIYEMFHQYRGPLDYTIPYIKENIKNPENLVIATNYEDTSYMYYLGSKVIIGYLANNLAADMKYTPDIVSYRKIPWWGRAEIFLKLLEKEKYDLVSFPVADYLYNNIPDLYFNLHEAHLFKTRTANNDKAKVVLFIKSGILPDSKK